MKEKEREIMLVKRNRIGKKFLFAGKGWGREEERDRILRKNGRQTERERDEKEREEMRKRMTSEEKKQID